MSLIRRAIGNRAVSPDLPAITRFLNDEVRPVLRDVRSKLNADLLTVVSLPQYATADLPALASDDRAIAWDTTLGQPVKWDGSAWQLL
jgi:hypothetical protein